MYILLELFYCFIDLFFLDLFVNVSATKRAAHKWYHHAMLMIVITIATYFCTDLNVPLLLSNCSCFLLMLVYCLIAYDLKPFKCLLLATIFLCLLSLCGTTALNIMSLFFQQAPSEFMLSYGYKRILFALFDKFLALLCVYFFSTIKTYSGQIPLKYNLLLCGISIITIFCTHILISMCMYTEIPSINAIFSLFTLIFFIFAFLCYKLVIKNSMITQEKKYASLLLHNQETLSHQTLQIDTLYQEMHQIRHDLLNHLSIVEHFVETKDYDTCLSYIHDLKHTTEAVPLYYHTGNSIVDALVNQKIFLNKELKISFKISCHIQNDLKIDSIDLCIILSNLLDNAIEAVVELPDSKRFISLSLYEKNNFLMLDISNSVLQSPLENETLKRRQKENMKEHGYGLMNINTVLQKYKGAIHYTCEENIFSSSILIPC